MVRVKNIDGKDITNNLVIDALPGRFQNPLKKPKLNKLTFGDIATVGKQLEKFRTLLQKKKNKVTLPLSCIKIY